MQLVIHNASIGFSPDEPLRRRVSLRVSSGEVCCILGPNGCGKTTLIKTILGASPLFDGTITLDGRDPATLSAAKLARAVAYVPQRTEVALPFTVREYVGISRCGTLRIGSRPTLRDRNKVDNALEQLGITDLADRHVDVISGGELQMAMIARAVAQEAKILILDEPTAALDYGNAVRVIERIRELADAGLGILMVTHNPDHAFMARANVALFRRDGRMEFGPAAQIVTRENVEAAYGANVRVVEFTHDNGEVMRMCAPCIQHRNKPQAGEHA